MMRFANNFEAWAIYPSVVFHKFLVNVLESDTGFQVSPEPAEGPVPMERLVHGLEARVTLGLHRITWVIFGTQH